MPIPLRRAAKAWPSSCSRIEAKKPRALTTASSEGRRGRAALAEHLAVEVREPEDHQEEDEEPRPVDRDPDPADVEQGDRAAAEHAPNGSGGQRIRFAAMRATRPKAGSASWLEELEQIDRPSRLRRRAPGGRVDRRALRRAGRRGADRGRAGARHLLVAARHRRRAGRPRRARGAARRGACSARCWARRRGRDRRRLPARPAPPAQAAAEAHHLQRRLRARARRRRAHDRPRRPPRRRPLRARSSTRRCPRSPTASG